MNNKGFSLLSVLLCLLLMSSFSLLTINKYVEYDNEHLLFINDYLLKQTNSLINRQEERIDKQNVFFYKSGRVNQAKTIEFDKHQVIIHIGNGYLTYE